MKLCRCCDWLLHGRRWVLLLPAAALLLLLPAPVSILLAAPVMMTAAMAAVFALRLRRAFGSEYARLPRPADALDQTILIDASLLDGGLCLRFAAQPFDAADRLTLRLGSGALLLGTAMTLTAQELPGAPVKALLDAAAQLGIQPDRMQQRSPVLHRSEENGVIRVSVRDGGQTRTFMLGSIQALCESCSAIWDGQIRPMTGNDRDRLLTACSADSQVYAFGTCQGDDPPVFLGYAGFGASVLPQARSDVQALRAMGLTVMLRDDEGANADLPALHRLLGLEQRHAQPDLYLSASRTHETPGCLTIRRSTGDSLERPVAWMKRTFAAVEREMTILAALMGTVLACCAVSGAEAAAVMTALWLGGCALLQPLRGTRPTWYAMAAAVALCLLSSLFLHAVTPAGGAPALTCLFLAGTFILAGYRGACTPRQLALMLLPLGPLTILTLALSALSPAAALFAAVMGVLAGATALLEQD